MANQKINGGASPYPVTVGPADIITITDGADDAPLKSAVVNIEPVQDLHGYDYPWPGGGGKNLLPDKFYSGGNYNQPAGTTFTLTELQDVTKTGDDYSKIVSSWNGISMLSNPLEAGTYRVSITYSATSGTRSTLYVLDENLTETRAIANSSLNGAWTNSITLSETEKYIFVWLGSNAASTVTFSKPMITAGSSSETFAPYSNICPISGWTQVNVTRAGANLFDKTTGAKNLYVGGTGGTTTGTGGTLLCFYAKKGVQYTINMTGGNRTNLYYYDGSISDIVAGITLTTVTLSAARPYTFIADRDATYCYYADTYYQQTVADSCTVNVGSTALPYSPYQGTPITISLGQTVYGGTLDVVSGKLTIDRAAVDLGTLTWNKDTNRTGIFYTYSFQNALPVEASAFAVISSSYKVANGKGAGNISNGELSSFPSYGEYRIFVKDESKYASLSAADFKTAVTGQTLVYELATPQEYDVTPQTISTLQGTNNIWADAGEMSIEYYPAQSSVVAVWDRTRHLYASIPLKYIRYDTYQINPSQAIDLDSYRSESGTLIRNVVGSKAKLEFNTPIMNDSQWSEVWGILSAGFNNTNEKKLKLKYYDTQSGSYKYGYFYVPDVNTQIMSIDEPNGVIQYNEIRLAFIEY